MAEYERWGELSDGAGCARHFPADYTPEDVATAEWLNTLYDIDGEQLPPRYAQTLLGDPQHAPASDDFEERTMRAVFERLALKRPVAAVRPAPQMRLRDRAALLVERMGRQITFGVMALAMLISYNALGTSAAFASVLQLIVGGTGTQSVATYPNVVDPQKAAASAADMKLNFTPRWPGWLSNQYFFVKAEVLSGQSWTNGAMVELHYERSDASGLHPLTILEFLPQRGMVLQVVKDGSTKEVHIGEQNGVFVWGQWVRQDRQHMVWKSSERAELIFGGNPSSEPVIWLASNGLGDMTPAQMQAAMVNMATHLDPMAHGGNMQPINGMSVLGQTLSQSVNQPFANDIIALVPDRSNPDAPVLLAHVDMGQEVPNDR